MEELNDEGVYDIDSIQELEGFSSGKHSKISSQKESIAGSPNKVSLNCATTPNEKN